MKGCYVTFLRPGRIMYINCEKLEKPGFNITFLHLKIIDNFYFLFFFFLNFLNKDEYFTFSQITELSIFNRKEHENYVSGLLQGKFENEKNMIKFKFSSIPLDTTNLFCQMMNYDNLHSVIKYNKLEIKTEYYITVVPELNTT